MESEASVGKPFLLAKYNKVYGLGKTGGFTTSFPFEAYSSFFIYFSEIAHSVWRRGKPPSNVFPLFSKGTTETLLDFGVLIHTALEEQSAQALSGL